MRFTYRLSWIYPFLFIFFYGFSSYADTPEVITGAWYSYEPSVVNLAGVLMEKLVYGPPGYGETPQKDRKINIVFFELTNPINLKADPADLRDMDDRTGVTEIQIDTSDSKAPLKKFLNKKVTLRGVLYEATSGTEFSSVLMTVNKAWAGKP
jgi:hypothetical protein